MDAWLTIRQVTEQTGVPAATLRAWERRYGFPVPQRTAGGHRRYSAADVERLARATSLVEQGWNASAAVRQVVEGGDDAAAGTVLTAQETAPAPAQQAADVDTEALVLLTRTLRALVRLERPEEAVGILREAVETLGGRVVAAEEAETDALPIDVSLGLAEPLLAAAEPFTLARMRLEAMLPGLVEDALLLVDRLRALEDC